MGENVRWRGSREGGGRAAWRRLRRSGIEEGIFLQVEIVLEGGEIAA